MKTLSEKLLSEVFFEDYLKERHRESQRRDDSYEKWVENLPTKELISMADDAIRIAIIATFIKKQ